MAPGRKVKKLGNFQNKISLKGCKWYEPVDCFFGPLHNQNFVFRRFRERVSRALVVRAPLPPSGVIPLWTAQCGGGGCENGRRQLIKVINKGRLHRPHRSLTHSISGRSLARWAHAFVTWSEGTFSAQPVERLETHHHRRRRRHEREALRTHGRSTTSENLYFFGESSISQGRKCK